MKSESLLGKDVEIFLKTPLFRFRYLFEGKESQLIENAIRLTGKVIGENNAGFILSVSDLSNQKEKQEVIPFEKIFLPFDKVDFLICV